MACADKVVVVGRRFKNVKVVFTSLVEQTIEVGSEINANGQNLRYHESLTMKKNM
jgi:hypothetical protein